MHFSNKAWKRGDTIVISIPKTIVELFNIKESDTITADLQLVNDIELHKLRTTFPLPSKDDQKTSD